MKPQADGGVVATDSGGEQIGLVLAGRGARGAYEVGALSVLLPALEAQGERVSVIIGTSAGALNGAERVFSRAWAAFPRIEGLREVEVAAYDPRLCGVIRPQSGEQDVGKPDIRVLREFDFSCVDA